MTDRVNEDCIVCMERNLALMKADGSWNGIQLTCCGASFCRSCYEKMDKSALETKIERTCPICRSPFPRSEKEAFNQAIKHAKVGRPWALDYVGSSYEFGKGVPQSFKKAFEFRSLAAAKGYATSQFSLGILYRDGEGCKQSYDEAFKYFNLAAAQGMAQAQSAVGNCYEFGWGVEKSLERAFEWYLRAADNEDITAQFNVGNCYYNGEGVERDYEKAFYFYTLTVNQGHKVAQFNLSVCYVNGEGVQESFVKAIYWLRQSLKDEKQCAAANECLEKILSFSSMMCASCHRQQPTFTLKCSQCLSAYYCDINCQRKHWKNCHKQECKEP